MTDLPTDFATLVGLHVVLAFDAGGFLAQHFKDNRPKPSHFIHHYRRNRNVLEVMTHEDPIYIAGELMSLSVDSIDTIPISDWSKYSKLVTLSAALLDKYGTAHLLDVGRAVLSDNEPSDETIADLDLFSSSSSDVRRELEAKRKILRPRRREFD